MPEQELREQIARKVYTAMAWAVARSRGVKPVPKWVIGGNSQAQDEARRAANEIIALLPKDEWRTEDGIPGSPSSPPSGRPERPCSDGGVDDIPTEVLIEPGALQDLIRDAFVAGCEAVQANYHPYNEPEFGEAAYDYVASLDFTETTRPHRAAPAPWRPEVRAFADLMEAKLRENDHKGGWANGHPCHLFDRLKEEAGELGLVIYHGVPSARRERLTVPPDPLKVGREAADVANFAMMIADVCGALAPQRGGAPETESQRDLRLLMNSVGGRFMLIETADYVEVHVSNRSDGQAFALTMSPEWFSELNRIAAALPAPPTLISQQEAERD